MNSKIEITKFIIIACFFILSLIRRFQILFRFSWSLNYWLKPIVCARKRHHVSCEIMYSVWVSIAVNDVVLTIFPLHWMVCLFRWILSTRTAMNIQTNLLSYEFPSFDRSIVPNVVIQIDHTFLSSQFRQNDVRTSQIWFFLCADYLWRLSLLALYSAENRKWNWKTLTRIRDKNWWPTKHVISKCVIQRILRTTRTKIDNFFK